MRGQTRGWAGGAPDRGAPEVAEGPVLVFVIIDTFAVVGRLIVVVGRGGRNDGNLGGVGGEAEVGAVEVRAGHLHHAPKRVLGRGIR